MKELLRRIFKKEIQEIIDECPKRVECPTCRKGYLDVNTVMGDDIVCENVMSIDRQSIQSDYEPYGWVIQQRVLERGGEWSNWWNNWKNKIYMSQTTAVEAMVQYNRYGDNPNREYRIVPIYHLPNAEVRRVKIDKLIKNEK